MPADGPAPPGAPPAPGRSPGGVLLLLVVLTALAQLVVAAGTAVMGLGWGGVTYLVALVQAGLLAFVLIAWLAVRRRLRLVLVPVLSAALTAGLLVAGTTYERATGCSSRERAAVEDLAAPPGATVEFEGEMVEGCVARATVVAAGPQEVLEHYRGELARLGWEETDDLHEGQVGTGGVKDGLRLAVETEPGEGGAETIEVVVGDPAGPTPCTVRLVPVLVDAPRVPTTGVEPGRWAVIVGAADPPATVVLRDASGAEVFSGRASSRPVGEGEQLELPDFVEHLVLAEGPHEVVCRPAEGPETVVPLTVGRDRGAAEQEVRLTLRVTDGGDRG